ncbi:MAG: hypothetical protein CFE21_14890 [Bacteroidetes bacterium B1(2017)]|nr:MAG: hypothetical protein CFE21_14890 [Bacteroidetes bacterium B1(2017)]
MEILFYLGILVLVASIYIFFHINSVVIKHGFNRSFFAGYLEDLVNYYKLSKRVDKPLRNKMILLLILLPIGVFFSLLLIAFGIVDALNLQ